MKLANASLIALALTFGLVKVAGATSYAISTPFAGFQKGATPGVAEYIGGLYVYALGVVGVVALATIIYWGVVYTLSAGLVSKKQDAIDGITQAVYGLLLLLGAYLVLYTINPSLVSLTGPATGTLLNVPAINAPQAEPAAAAPQQPMSFTAF